MKRYFVAVLSFVSFDVLMVVAETTEVLIAKTRTRKNGKHFVECVV